MSAEPLTAEELERLESLCDAQAPGPWHAPDGAIYRLLRALEDAERRAARADWRASTETSDPVAG